MSSESRSGTTQELGKHAAARSRQRKQSVRRLTHSLAWAGSVLGAMVTAMAVAYGTGVGHGFFTATAGHLPPAGPPVAIESVQYQQAMGQELSFAFPQELTPQQVAVFNGGKTYFQRYMSRITAMGGAIVSDAPVQIVLRGNMSTTVVITGVRVEKQCGRPLAGTLLYTPPEGMAPDIQMGFNLDAAFPVAQDANSGGLSGSFFAEHTISLAPGEMQSLLIQAISDQQYCQFTYQLTVDADGRQVTEPISNDGRPFAVTAPLIRLRRGKFPSFASYERVYEGGPGSPANGAFVAVNPKIFTG